jgi:GNAT superfamily N-acetyltransferase
MVADNAQSKYIIKAPANIYDYTKDPENLHQQVLNMNQGAWNEDKFHGLVKQKGYAGVKWSISPKTHVVQLYHPQSVHEEQVLKSEELEKGLKGDWQKEGYVIKRKEGPNKAGLENAYTLIAKSPNGDIVGEASFAIHPDGENIIVSSAIHPDHRRKGLATEMYKMAEKEFNLKIKRTSQTPDAKSLWAQPNRPFGKSEELSKAPVEYKVNPEGSISRPLSGLSPAYKVISEKTLPNGLKYKHFKSEETDNHVHRLYHPETNEAMSELMTQESFDETPHHKVIWSQVSPNYKGKGLGKQIYLAALVHGKGMKGLTSDNQLSQNAHKMWTSMRLVPGIGGKIAKYVTQAQAQKDPEAADIAYDEPHHIFIRDSSKLNYNLMFPKVDLPMPLAASEVNESEELEKGLKGDWQKEGYTLHHSDMPDTDSAIGHHLVTAKLKGKTVGQLRYFNQPTFGSKERELYTGMLEVLPNHRRKGLGNAMHAAAEERHGIKFAESSEKTKLGEKFYSQPNRPFGKSEELTKTGTLTHDDVNEYFRKIGQGQTYSQGYLKEGHTPLGLPHGEYELKEVPLHLINVGTHEHPFRSIDPLGDTGNEEQARHYASLESEPPPIIVKPHNNGFKTLDGVHRARAAALKGKKTIKAYVHKSPVNLGKSEELTKNDSHIKNIANHYAKLNGIKLSHNYNVNLNPEHGKTIASAYEAMPHTPEHPETQAAYNALIDETGKQFKHLINSGLKISRMEPDQENPYKTSKDMLHDLHVNNHLWYYPTEQGFGAGEQSKNHPMLKETGFKHNGVPLLANDIFRISHDAFGHGLTNSAFGPKGEHASYLAHKEMFSPLAQKALATETMGQNSTVNFGKNAAHNKANPKNTIYAEQKAGLLPEYIINGEWHK